MENITPSLTEFKTKYHIRNSLKDVRKFKTDILLYLLIYFYYYYL